MSSIAGTASIFDYQAQAHDDLVVMNRLQAENNAMRARIDRLERTVRVSAYALDLIADDAMLDDRYRINCCNLSAALKRFSQEA